MSKSPIFINDYPSPKNKGKNTGIIPMKEPLNVNLCKTYLSEELIEENTRFISNFFFVSYWLIGWKYYISITELLYGESGHIRRNVS